MKIFVRGQCNVYLLKVIKKRGWQSEVKIIALSSESFSEDAGLYISEDC